MLTEDELERVRNGDEPAFVLAVLFIVLILLTICVLSVKLVNLLIQSRQTPTQVIPLVDIPTAMPVNDSSIYFPIILNGSVPLSLPVSEPIWVVTKIDNLGYPLDGQYYDLATFKRLDSQETADAYCIDRGLDAPVLGTEYRLNPEGIFVPLDNSHPIQRFLRIQ